MWPAPPDSLMSDTTPSRTRLRIVLVDDREDRRVLLKAALDEVGCQVAACASTDENLLPVIERHDPDVVILDMEAPGRDTLENLAHVQARIPRPIVMFTQDDDGDSIRRAVRAGVSAYIVDGLQGHRVRPIIEAAIARFEHFRALELELEKTRTELQERKLIEKAKGIVMRQRGVSEAEAYQAMRKLAMRSNKRVVDIAESIIAAAELLV